MRIKEQVIDMCRQGGKKVVIVTVNEEIRPELSSLMMEEIKEKAEKLKEEFEKKDILTKLYVTQGIASREIVEIADREIPSLIAMAAVGAGGAKKLGRTADNVLRRVTCPVYIHR